MKHITRTLSVVLIAVLLALPALTVGAARAWHTMEETPSPTPTEDVTPTPDGNETPTPEENTPTPDNETPTPDGGETPTPTPDDNETPTPTHNQDSRTPVPTKKPSIYTEPTRDPYDPSTRVTNPPPTMAPDVTLPDDIATPVPEEETPAASVGSLISNDPTVGLLVLFGVLIILLALDIAVIIWRKNLGFSGLINGGVAVRKVEESMESDEQTVEDDEP